MRLSYSLGSLLTIEQVLACSKKLNRFKPDTVWIPETWGMENFSMLSLASKENNFSRIGSSIINIYSRSPSLIAMGAVTVDTISNKRLILGLGTSSQPLVEDFHGDKFERPLKRMKEYVEIIRLILSGKSINYSGEIFSLKNFSLLIKPPRNTIPIYLAAVNQKMVELTWKIADGVIFYLRPKSEIKSTLSRMQNQKKIDASLQIITCVNEDSEKAIIRAKKTLAFYVSVGKIYREFLATNGFENETKNIYEEYEKNGLQNNHEQVPESMVNELCIAGTSNESRNQLKQFCETGIDLPIIQFNPTDNVENSFDLVTSTFSESCD
ncbi:LLM class flavin-dependent oxidoreductase [Marine Group I thaumarchaeote]|uniref:LLM class flavin-dependent oxidoreductase n=1 Tax=Marine Group I thaumarchaeote TaxID=2511932 RepID=A0A7K4NL04_9ARCH|nr:LLM class flavin-dependent oxidoreductase [Marine Group I thaumarchaeote]